MPKITTQVARKRYKRVPVMEPDPDNPGQERQKRVEVNRTRRSGAAVTKLVFANDKDQPLPPRKCEVCKTDLVVGQKYKSIGIKMQYGGIVRYRCMNCPTWQPHEYSSALWARISQIQNEEIDGSAWEGEEDAQARADEIAEMIRELASEKQESFDNMPEGLQQGDTGQELEMAAQNLEGWADEFDSISWPDLESGEDEECGECEGTGEIGKGDSTKQCEQCGGEGTLTSEGPTAEQMDEWREEAAQVLQDTLDNAPQ